MHELGTVIVTGGASGLGAAVAEAVEGAGGSAVVFDRQEPHNGFALFEQVDLARTREAEASVRRTAERNGGLSGVVTAAGIDSCGKLEDVRLLVSELVTNSLVHAGLSPDEAITVTVTVQGGLARGEVRDRGPGFEPPQEPVPKPDLAGGWGLYIVDRVAARWGVARTGSKSVWFEIDLDD